MAGDRFLGICGSIFISAFSQVGKFTETDKWFIPLTILLWLYVGNQRRTAATLFNPFVSTFSIAARAREGSWAAQTSLVGGIGGGSAEEGSGTGGGEHPHAMEYLLVSTAPQASFASRVLDVGVQLGYIVLYVALTPRNTHSVLISYYYFMIAFVTIRLPILFIKLINTFRERKASSPV